MYSQVIEFFDKYELPFNQEYLNLQLYLVEEEFEEWLDESFRMNNNSAEKELKELCDLIYTLLGYLYQLDGGVERKYIFPEVSVEVIPAIEDMLEDAYSNPKQRATYELVLTAIIACVEYAKENEWNLEEAFTRVHLSNMTKLKDGPGKIQKGPDYVKPTLKDLV